MPGASRYADRVAVRSQGPRKGEYDLAENHCSRLAQTLLSMSTCNGWSIASWKPAFETEQ